MSDPGDTTEITTLLAKRQRFLAIHMDYLFHIAAVFLFALSKYVRLMERDIFSAESLSFSRLLNFSIALHMTEITCFERCWIEEAHVLHFSIQKLLKKKDGVS